MTVGSIEFRYDPNTRTRTAIYAGVITDDVLVGAYERLIGSADFVNPVHDLADLRGATQVALTADGLRRLGEIMGSQPPLPPSASLPGLAIVADQPAAFGLARMYEMMTEGRLAKQTMVFSTVEDARTWLARLPTPQPQPIR